MLKELKTDYEKISKDFIPRNKWLGFLIYILSQEMLGDKNIPVAVGNPFTGIRG